MSHSLQWYEHVLRLPRLRPPRAELYRRTLPSLSLSSSLSLTTPIALVPLGVQHLHSARHPRLLHKWHAARAAHALPDRHRDVHRAGQLECRRRRYHLAAREARRVRPARTRRGGHGRARACARGAWSAGGGHPTAASDGVGGQGEPAGGVGRCRILNAFDMLGRMSPERVATASCLIVIAKRSQRPIVGP